MGVVPDHDVDAGTRRLAAPLRELERVGAHLAFIAVVDGQDSQGRLGLGQPAQHLAKIVVEAVGDLPRLVCAGAVALQIVGDDAHGSEGDGTALDRDELRAACLLAVHADAGGGQHAMTA